MRNAVRACTLCSPELLLLVSVFIRQSTEGRTWACTSDGSIRAHEYIRFGCSSLHLSTQPHSDITAFNMHCSTTYTDAGHCYITAKRLAGKNVSKMTLTLTQSINADNHHCSDDVYW